MSKILVTPPDRADAIHDLPNERLVLHVEDLEVLQVSDTASIYLQIRAADIAYVLPLSLPTALRLAKILRQAVKRYLNPPQKKNETPETE